MKTPATPSLFEKHPRVTIFITVVFILILLCVALEIVLRFFVEYSPSYYTGVRGVTNKVLQYPYGDIPINEDGFPDKDFLSNKERQRIAYIGDSVCFGVGAGYGYRISELLESALPAFEHLNLAFGLDTGMNRKNIKRVLSWVDEYHIDKVVYLMNLNDLLPDDVMQSNESSLLGEVKSYLDVLRGKSYLYSYVVYKVVGGFLLTKLNMTATGHIPRDFFTDEKTLQDTTDRIIELNMELQKKNVALAVVLLPYEMQISQEAEDTYKENGVRWSDGFIKRDPQIRIMSVLDSESIFTLDAYLAFVGHQAASPSRDEVKVGEFYVYNLGDRLDWNHPNKKGHRAISDFLVRNRAFQSFLETEPSRKSSRE